MIYNNGIKKNGYVLQFSQAGNVSPADSTTYYMGNVTTLITTRVFTVIVPYPGTLKEIRGRFTISNPGTNESVTLNLDKNGGATLISNALNFSNSIATFSYTGSIQVTPLDNLVLALTTPAWATNPTGVKMQASAWVQIG